MKNFRFKLKNVATIVACSAVMIFVSSCGDDEDKDDKDGSFTSIDVTLQGVSPDVKEVRLIVFSGNTQVLKTAAFSNEKFRIDLPETVSDNYLYKFDSRFSPGVVVSNPDALMSSEIGLVCYDGSGENANRIGWFVFRNEAETAVLSLTYAKSDFTIKGEHSEQDGDRTNNFKFDLSLKKGWNKIYLVNTLSTRTESYSMVEPAGLSWYFDLPEE